MNSNRIINLFYSEYLIDNKSSLRPALSAPQRYGPIHTFSRGEIACLKKGGVKIIVKRDKIEITLII